MKFLRILLSIFRFAQTRPSKVEVKDKATDAISDLIKKDDPLVEMGVAIAAEELDKVVTKVIKKRI